MSRVDIEDLEEELGPVRDLDAEFAEKLKMLQIEREKERQKDEAARVALAKVNKAMQLHGVGLQTRQDQDEEKSTAGSGVGELDELDFDVPSASKFKWEEPETPPQNEVFASGGGDVSGGESSDHRSELVSDYFGDDGSERSSVLEVKMDHFSARRSGGLPGQRESDSEGDETRSD